MGSRPPQIHTSALSPQEYEAYTAILLDFEKKVFQDSEIQVNQVWNYLKTWLGEIDKAGRESEFLSFFRNIPASSLTPSHTLLALLRLYAHSQNNSLLTRDHIFVQTDPVPLSQPLSAKPSNNPFLSSDWANRGTSILTPPSSIPSPTSPLSPVPPILSKVTPPSQGQPIALASPPASISQPVSHPATRTPPDIPSHRPNLPPPRRPSTNSATTQRSVSASTPSSQSTILAPSTSSAPPLPIRRSVSLHHPSPGTPATSAQAHSTTQLSRASTVKSRPPPPVPPLKAPKPSSMTRTSSSNAHIGLTDSLDLRKSTEPETANASVPTGNRSRKSSLSLIGGAGGGMGTGSKSRSRSNSSASNPPKPSPSEYTYSPIATSSLATGSASPLASPSRPPSQAVSTPFESFAVGSVVLPPKPSRPLPPPSHPDRRRPLQVNSKTSSSTGTTPIHNHTLASTSPPTNRSKLGSSQLDPFASGNSSPLSKQHHSTASTIAGGASQRVREVLGTFGGGGGVRNRRKCLEDGETEEKDGLIQSEKDDGFEDERGDVEEEDEIGDDRETESSETEDEGEIGEKTSAKGEKRERMKEVEREARRRDEQGQWIQLV